MVNGLMNIITKESQLELFSAFEGMHQDVIERMRNSFSRLIKEINESMNRILTAALYCAEDLESTIICEGQRFKFESKDETNVQEDTKQDLKRRKMKSTFINMIKNGKVGQLETKVTDSVDDSTHNENSFQVGSVPEIDGIKDEINTNLNGSSKEGPDTKIHKNIEMINLSTTDSKKFMCPECDYITPHKSWMETHIKAVHKKIKDFTCGHCSYASAWKDTLKRHIRTQHPFNF